ncbi:uncharacterized protein LOC142344009 [Convolutriloba macropyga]|uniref:uncharacterized protein LOC142344009 n=1 Tax=Convolutriloba macropyga TaxID=536237 RepID=UPI003F521181
MKFLPNMLGFLGPLGYHPPEKDGDFNIIQDVQSRPLTYSVIPMSVMTHHQINYWTCKNPNFYHRNHFARGIWRLPIIMFCFYSAAQPLEQKRRNIITLKDTAVAQMVERHPLEFRDITERKKTYARHFTDYAKTNFL